MKLIEKALLGFSKVALIVTLLSVSACGSGVPDEVSELVFEQSDFADPVTLRLPEESSREFYEKAKAGNAIDCGGMLPTVTIQKESFSAEDLEAGVRGFLAETEPPPTESRWVRDSAESRLKPHSTIGKAVFVRGAKRR